VWCTDPSQYELCGETRVFEMVNKIQMSPRFLQPPLLDLVFVFSFGDSDERDFAYGALPYEATGKYHSPVT